MMATKIIAAAAAVGNLLNGWDSATLAGALLYIEPEFNLDVQPVLEGAVAAASLIGAAVSTIFAGSGADWLGRRKMLCISATLYCIGSLLMLWSPNVYLLLVARIVDGVGVGLAVTVAPLCISEVSPAEIRGELNTLPQLLGTSGMFLAYCMVFGISLTTSPNWRMMLGLMLIPSFIYLILGLYYLPESPRWLVSKGRTKEAKQVLQWLRSKQDVTGEMALLVEGLGVGQDSFLEEYIIQPTDFIPNDPTDIQDDSIAIFTPDGGAYIAKPVSSFTGSNGFFSRPASVIGTPVLTNSLPFMDSTVTLMGSLKGSFIDHLHGIMHSHVQGHHMDAVDDIREDEENGCRPPEANGYHSDTSDVDNYLTSPLLSRHSSEHWNGSDLHRGDSFKSIKGNSHDLVAASVAPHEGLVGSNGIMGIGSGWQLAIQVGGPQETEGKPDHGSYKRIFLFQEPSMVGAGEVSSYSLPRFGSILGEVESVPAAALVSRPSQYGKQILSENPVGPALLHPAETATKGPAWSELFEGGVKQALIVGVTLQILEQMMMMMSRKQEKERLVSMVNDGVYDDDIENDDGIGKKECRCKQKKEKGSELMAIYGSIIYVSLSVSVIHCTHGK